MVSSIVFLGSGTDSYVIGKSMRGSGGIILKVEGVQFHIDPGPNTIVSAVQNNVNLRENTAVLVSHNHLCHCNDLNAVIDAMTLSGVDKRGVLVASQSVINGSENMIRTLSKYHESCLERIIVLNSDKVIGIEDVEIHALRTSHTDPSAVGFKFITDDFVLSYSSDTGYFSKLCEFYKGSDILILNVVNPSGVSEEGNLSSDDAVKIIHKVGPRLAIIQHFGSKMLKADPLYEARKIQHETGVQVIAAKDGMIISPTSYSANSKQKRLKSFDESK